MSLETLFSSNIIVPIIVAFIGFLIAVTTAIIAKEHKVSEFRQAWIDALRQEISDLSSISYKLIAERSNFFVQKERLEIENIESGLVSAMRSVELIGEINSLSTKIRLRLNKLEHIKLIEEINKLRDETVQLKPETRNGIKILFNIETIAHEVLKTEWEKVKKGENQFIKFKYISKLLASTFLISMWVLFSIAMLQSEIFQ